MNQQLFNRARGYSLTISIGKLGGVLFLSNPFFSRLGLGFVSIIFWRVDIDQVLAELLLRNMTYGIERTVIQPQDPRLN